MDAKIEALAERVERLEQENRALKRRVRLLTRVGGITLILAFLVVIGGARRAEGPKVVEAERFILKDPDGKMRSQWGLYDDRSAGFVMYGEDGKDRLSLLVKRGGASNVIADVVASGRFILKDRQGRMCSEWGHTEDRITGFQIYGEDGKARLTLLAEPDGASHFRLYDRQGQRRLESGVTPNGTVGSFLLDTEGKVRQRLRVGADGTPEIDLANRAEKTGLSLWIKPEGANLGLFDQDGVPRLAMAVQEDTGLIGILDKANKKMRLLLTVDAEGAPHLWLRDKDGEALFEAPQP